MKETPLSNPFQSTSASDGQPGGRYKKPNANASCDATEISDDLVARIIFSWKKNSCLSIDVVNELEDFPSTFLSPLKSLVAKKILETNDSTVDANQAMLFSELARIVQHGSPFGDVGDRGPDDHLVRTTTVSNVGTSSDKEVLSLDGYFDICTDCLLDISTALSICEKTEQQLSCKLSTRLQAMPAWCFDFIYGRHSTVFPKLKKYIKKVTFSDLVQVPGEDYKKISSTLSNIRRDLQASVQPDLVVTKSKPKKPQKGDKQYHIDIQSRTRGNPRLAKKCKEVLLEISEFLKRAEKNQTIVNSTKLESRFDHLPQWCTNFVSSRHPNHFAKTEKSAVRQSYRELLDMPEWFGDTVSLLGTLSNIRRDLVEAKGLVELKSSSDVKLPDDSKSGESCKNNNSPEELKKQDKSNTSNNRQNTLDKSSDRNDHRSQIHGSHSHSFTRAIERDHKRTPDREHRSARDVDYKRRTPDREHRSARDIDNKRRTPDREHRSARDVDYKRRTPDREHMSARDINNKRRSPDREHRSARDPDYKRRSPDKEHMSARDINNKRRTPDREHRSARDVDYKRRTPGREHRSARDVDYKRTPDREHKPARDIDYKRRTPDREHRSARDVDHRNHHSSHSRSDKDYRSSRRSSDREHVSSRVRDSDHRSSKRDDKDYHLERKITEPRHGSLRDSDKEHDSRRKAEDRDYRATHNARVEHLTSGNSRSSHKSLTRHDQDYRASEVDLAKSIQKVDSDYRATAMHRNEINSLPSHEMDANSTLYENSEMFSSYVRDDPDDRIPVLAASGIDRDFRSPRSGGDSFETVHNTKLKLLHDSDTTDLQLACDKIDKILESSKNAAIKQTISEAIGCKKRDYGFTEDDPRVNNYKGDNDYSLSGSDTRMEYRNYNKSESKKDLREIINEQKRKNSHQHPSEEYDQSPERSGPQLEEIFEKGKLILEGMPSNLVSDKLTSENFYKFLQGFNKTTDRSQPEHSFRPKSYSETSSTINKQYSSAPNAVQQSSESERYSKSMLDVDNRQSGGTKGDRHMYKTRDHSLDYRIGEMSCNPEKIQLNSRSTPVREHSVYTEMESSDTNDYQLQPKRKHADSLPQKTEPPHKIFRSHSPLKITIKNVPVNDEKAYSEVRTFVNKSQLPESQSMTDASRKDVDNVNIMPSTNKESNFLPVSSLSQKNEANDLLQQILLKAKSKEKTGSSTDRSCFTNTRDLISSILKPKGNPHGSNTSEPIVKACPPNIRSATNSMSNDQLRTDERDNTTNKLPLRSSRPTEPNNRNSGVWNKDLAALPTKHHDFNQDVGKDGNTYSSNRIETANASDNRNQPTRTSQSQPAYTSESREPSTYSGNSQNMPSYNSNSQSPPAYFSDNKAQPAYATNSRMQPAYAIERTPQVERTSGGQVPLRPQAHNTKQASAVHPTFKLDGYGSFGEPSSTTQTTDESKSSVHDSQAPDNRPRGPPSTNAAGKPEATNPLLTERLLKAVKEKMDQQARKKEQTNLIMRLDKYCDILPAEVLGILRSPIALDKPVMFQMLCRVAAFAERLSVTYTPQQKETELRGYFIHLLSTASA